ncbi:MAG TPA: TonB-dependent receptor, partial [Salinimicrobium sp.]|nr:TonB-dependent receptor [Salinimicrobium sp.]
LIDSEYQNLGVTIGANYRNKERDFASQFSGVEEHSTTTLNPSSIDGLSSIFTPENFDAGLLLINELQPDRYNATLESAAGFLTANYNSEKFYVTAGIRFQSDNLNVVYDVGNLPGRIGSSQLSYENFYPSLNFKYQLNDRNNIRLAASKTISLPEFKEVSPFEYVSQTGEVTRGNPDVKASTNYNLDLKYEFYPSNSQLVSITGFYKRIVDPINKVQDRGSAGVYSYFNTSEKAEIYGLEMETNLELLTPETTSGIELDLNLNATRMWHFQDLKVIRNEDGTFIKTYRYKGLTEIGLEGASNWIFNGSLNFSTNAENELRASIIANYASDKIYALGAPEIQTQSETFYNDAIIEKGFATLNAVLSKDFGEHWNLEFTGENLLNPEIKRTQKIKPSISNIETTETLRSYTKGVVLSLGINYNF